MSQPASGTGVSKPGPSRTRSYSSKVDGVWIFLGLSCGAAFLAGAIDRGPDSVLGARLIQFATVVATIFILLGVPCRYTLLDQALRIQSGFFIRSVAYADILSASPERSAGWAPALSCDRLVLHCRNGSIRVSPVRQAEFLNHLQGRLATLKPPA
jgi:Bacterial PH domain